MHSVKCNFIALFFVLRKEGNVERKVGKWKKERWAIERSS
jgi:hypothetical protein